MQSYPCKDCNDRHPKCWGECEKYAKARAESDKVKAKSRQEALYRSTNQVLVNACIKSKREGKNAFRSR